MFGASWKKRFKEHLSSHFGEKQGSMLFNRYVHGFSAGYVEDFSFEIVTDDIEHMESLSETKTIVMSFYGVGTQLQENLIKSQFHFKLFKKDSSISLSEIFPVLEHMGLQVIGEHPYIVSLENKTAIFINDFIVSYPKVEKLLDTKIQELFEDAFIHILKGEAENDLLNHLILNSQVYWRDIIILRAYTKYLRQISMQYSLDFITKALVSHAGIASDLILLFKQLFGLKKEKNSKNKVETIELRIKENIEKVANLDEDKILRSILLLVKATLRTNYFQTDEFELPKPYVSLKFKCSGIPMLPKPVPLFEIFVYSNQFEGVHLRSSKVARGGIRWSDRPEDFRTEILGLMKAQKVKNVVIVPSGAKGGFVVKQLPTGSREAIQAAVVSCYQSFISALIELTDNLKDGRVIHPKDVVSYDDDDTYLVVAADKGTATFSDIANEISLQHNFWLGDAFASGGKTGYDHKKMGITARGAWESVKRLFYDLDINARQTIITTIGIGDMSGDVFGNGLLYSRKIKLIAAFDHRNIFLDPNPDPEISFRERERLFQLPYSSWDDYDKKVISEGGGVYSRSSKTIRISAAVKERLGTDIDTFEPSELIKVILKAPVDLLWNGGIGTYVKARSESHVDVGDKANDLIRINGDELRCKVVAEGGNLGFTQLGRVEFALKGGSINTDFIDNSAGVDCSDHEVNIKILLNLAVSKGRLNESERNKLLLEMTDEIAKRVLRNNYHQNLTISTSYKRADKKIDFFEDYLKAEIASGHIDPEVEFLPSEQQRLERKLKNQGLTRPEIAILLAYSKMYLKQEILQSKLVDDPEVLPFVYKAFPSLLKKLYLAEMIHHPLYREIIATQLSNHIINNIGITFTYRMHKQTGATVAEIVKAYLFSEAIFNVGNTIENLELYDAKIPAKIMGDLLYYLRELMTLSSRWFLFNITAENDRSSLIEFYRKNIEILFPLIAELMGGATKDYMEKLKVDFTMWGIPIAVAENVSVLRAMYGALNIVDLVYIHQFDIKETAKIFFEVGSRFNLLWFRDQLQRELSNDYWKSLLAASALRDQLDLLQKLLTTLIMQNISEETDPHARIELWISQHQRLMNRWEEIISHLKSSTHIDFLEIYIALGELSNLAKTTE